jgi:hypothetical protein
MNTDEQFGMGTPSTEKLTRPEGLHPTTAATRAMFSSSAAGLGELVSVVVLGNLVTI